MRESRGLAELVGSRAPLSQSDGNAPVQSASWTPAAPWFSGRNLSSLLPDCLRSDADDCGASYSDEVTAEVQAALWETQISADCADARYLVLDQSWPSGLGSSLRIHVYMLGLAIRCALKRSSCQLEGARLRAPPTRPS